MWNTIQKQRTSALAQAIFTLETLTHPDSTLIIEYLADHEEASLLDLAVHTGFDAAVLEYQLELLMDTRVVCTRGNLYGNKFALNQKRIAKINAIACRLIGDQ